MQRRPYEDLIFYKNICEIRIMINQITKRFEKTHLRLVSQMRDSARSAKQNIREGYRRGTLGMFLNSIRISQGSLEELSGDIEDCFEDKLITKEEFDRFNKLFFSASYISNQYLKSMNGKNKEWNVPLIQPKSTSRNPRNIKEHEET